MAVNTLEKDNPLLKTGEAQEFQKEEPSRIKVPQTRLLESSSIERVRSYIRATNPLYRKQVLKQIQSMYGNPMLYRIMEPYRLYKQGAMSAVNEEHMATQGFSGETVQYPHKTAVENTLGLDLSGVKAHIGNRAETACDTLSAEAYTFKGEVAFNSSTPTFGTAVHEAVHLAQQSGIPLAANSGTDFSTNALESEAYSIEREVTSGRTISPSAPAGKDAGGEVQAKEASLSPKLLYPALKKEPGTTNEVLLKGKYDTSQATATGLSPQANTTLVNIALALIPGFTPMILAINALGFEVSGVALGFAGSGWVGEGVGVGAGAEAAVLVDFSKMEVKWDVFPQVEAGLGIGVPAGGGFQVNVGYRISPRGQYGDLKESYGGTSLNVALEALGKLGFAVDLDLLGGKEGFVTTSIGLSPNVGIKITLAASKSLEELKKTVRELGQSFMSGVTTIVNGLKAAADTISAIFQGIQSAIGSAIEEALAIFYPPRWNLTGYSQSDCKVLVGFGNVMLGIIQKKGLSDFLKEETSSKPPSIYDRFTDERENFMVLLGAYSVLNRMHKSMNETDQDLADPFKVSYIKFLSTMSENGLIGVLPWGLSANWETDNPQFSQVKKKSLEAGKSQTVLKRGQASAQNEEQEALQGFSGETIQYPHQSTIENSLGMDLSGVKVHVGAKAQDACEVLSAEAYTYKGQVAFKTKTPTLETAAHEATHLAQAGGVPLSGIGNGFNPVDSSVNQLEHEADLVSHAVTMGKRVDKKVDTPADIPPDSSLSFKRTKPEELVTQKKKPQRKEAEDTSEFDEIDAMSSDLILKSEQEYDDFSGSWQGSALYDLLKKAVDEKALEKYAESAIDAFIKFLKDNTTQTTGGMPVPDTFYNGVKKACTSYLQSSTVKDFLAGVSQTAQDVLSNPVAALIAGLVGIAVMVGANMSLKLDTSFKVCDQLSIGLAIDLNKIQDIEFRMAKVQLTYAPTPAVSVTGGVEVANLQPDAAEVKSGQYDAGQKKLTLFLDSKFKLNSDFTLSAGAKVNLFSQNGNVFGEYSADSNSISFYIRSTYVHNQLNASLGVEAGPTAVTVRGSIGYNFLNTPVGDVGIVGSGFVTMPISGPDPVSGGASIGLGFTF